MRVPVKVPAFAFFYNLNNNGFHHYFLFFLKSYQIFHICNKNQRSLYIR